MQIDFRMSDAAIVFATLLGPIFAVRIQKFMDRRGEQERRQVEVYRTLMASRANPNSPQYVNALNSVPLEFHKVKPVMDAWTDLLLHLNSKSDANPDGDLIVHLSQLSVGMLRLKVP